VLTRNTGVLFPKALAVWACVVKVGTHIAMPVTVAVDDNTEVVAAFPGWLLKEVKPKLGALQRRELSEAGERPSPQMWLARAPQAPIPRRKRR
jgi:hypothetical protein